MMRRIAAVLALAPAVAFAPAPACAHERHNHGKTAKNGQENKGKDGDGGFCDHESAGLK